MCSLIAKAYGLEVANCNIEIFDGIKVLVIDRFDRRFSEDNSWLMRLPQEDLCQALGYSPNLKYEADGGPGIKDIMRLLHGANDSGLNKEMFFRSQVLFFMLAAIDGHAKNFSLFLKPYGSYEMTPLYDIISAYPLIDKKQLQNKSIILWFVIEVNSFEFKKIISKIIRRILCNRTSYLGIATGAINESIRIQS